MAVKFFDSRGGEKKVFYKFHLPKFCRLGIWQFDCIRFCYHSLSLFLKGGITDSIICVSPDTWKGKDLLEIPHELYHPCPFPSLHLQSSQVPQLGADHQAVPRLSESHSTGERDHRECEIKPKPRPANLRHAMATIVITGVVCGIVCLMMLAAAIYGCTYAAITAQDHGGRLAQNNEPTKTEGKELFDSSLA